MFAVVVALLGALRSTIRSPAQLVVENLALRHQLAVLLCLGSEGASRASEGVTLTRERQASGDPSDASYSPS